MRKIDEYITSKIQEKTFFTFDVWNFFEQKKILSWRSKYICIITWNKKKIQGSFKEIHSWLLRLSTARGTSSRSSLGGPTKVKACKYFLFTESSLTVWKNEIKNFFDDIIN